MGSVLLVVTVMAVGACLISIAFGKLTVRHQLFRQNLSFFVQDIVYDKPKTLDSTFDAGGETSSSLIAVSNMCEFINIQTILGKQSFYLRQFVANMFCQM